ncbi:PREDICTED: xyloside xylosyltransferase 1-like [Priapulus caudatus]|uniref:Xyloside xylosyltransferase 1-like n=1 Tax=Priapulus caudatus TaxID=37621 RepID=A0ABM1F0M0_PRICU|nr:PREDICTED: xyloside xylosyltransferase 1-like [Priapulus caudatus]
MEANSNSFIQSNGQQLKVILFHILQEQKQSRKPVGQPETVHILMFFAKAEKNDLLQQQLRANIRSMVKHATGRIKYHFLGDANSTRIAADILENVFDTIPHSEDLVIQVQTYEVESVVAKVGHDVWPIQQLFKSYRKKYNLFNDIFYFIPFALHKVIDLVEVESHDIKGGCRPEINDRIPKTLRYIQAAVAERNLRYLMRKYYFTKSHLGDQEVVTILGMEYPELFHTLPCTWNRQLCRKYARSITMPSALFGLFNRCDGAVNLYHGNCHTLFPPEAEL